ncbi:MAG: sensor histidine kinase [Saprospiraceae bacterium]|nr:sensor histidine kinase [Lewinella sp.]
MKANVLITLLLCFGVHAVGAQPRAAQLRKDIQNAGDDGARLDAMLDLAQVLLMYKNDSVLVLSDDAQELAERIGENEKALQARTVVGLYRHQQGDRKTAKRLFFGILKTAREQDAKSMVPVIYNNLAQIYRRDGQRDSAFYYWSEAEKEYEAAGYPYEVWRVCLGLGQIFSEKGDLVNGEQYLRKAYDIAANGDNRIDQGYTLFHLGSFYFSTENFSKLEEVKAIWDERQAARSTSREIMELPEHTSMLYLFGQTDKDAIPRLQRAAQFYREKNAIFSEAWVLENLGIFLIRAQRNAEGEAALEEALDIFQRNGSKVRIGAVRYQLYQHYQSVGAYEKSLQMLVAYSQLKDSLRSEEIEDNLAQLQVQYETEKKEQLLRIQDLELKQKTQERNLLLGASVLLGLLALSIFLGYRQRLRANQQLSAQEAELQDQRIRQLEQENHLLSLTAMIEGQESERQRIAQDLHDGIGGLLTTVKAHFYAIQEQVEKLQQLNIYKKTNDLIDEACQEVRRISQNMMPRSLQLLGLRGAIEDLATQLRHSGLACELEIIGLPEDMDQTRSVMLYRIIQELCQNISKHAAAENVFIQLLGHGSELSLIVEDDGRGFDYNRVKGSSPSLGLKNIESRVKFLKGSLEVDSVIDEGTTVMIQIPE